MKTKRYDGNDIRRILCGMIMDKVVCSKITRIWEGGGLFESKWANIVGAFATDYFKRFGEPLKQQIQSVFEGWAATTKADDETVRTVERFLVALSDEYQEEPSEYILDVAGRHFYKVRAEQAIERAKEDLERGREEDADTTLSRIKKINLGRTAFVEVDTDVEEWADLTDQERTRPLVRYRGDLGEFIGNSLYRGTLNAFMAPDKTGKTTWLIDAGYRAVRGRNRVAHFDMGDGDKKEMLLRLACRIAGKPEFEGDVMLPEGWDDKGDLQTKTSTFTGVDPFESFRELKKIAQGRRVFRLSCHENSSTTVGDIDGILQEWEDDGWRPDVVVIDYADIIAPPKGIKDPLDQIDELWKQLRRLSQRRHCLVLTATQSSASAYGKENYLLSRSDFSGRKTKLAHVNGMIGINVSPKEKDVGAARVNWIVRRKGKYNEKHYVRVAGSMAIGNPAILSKR